MRESTRGEMTAFFGITIIVYAIMVGTHFYWLRSPGQMSHSFKAIGWYVWFAVFAIPAWRHSLSLRCLIIGIVIGGSLNVLVVSANGGFMPVIGKTGGFFEGPWVPAVPSHSLLWLADRVDWYGVSPGDIVLFGTLLILAAVHLSGVVVKLVHSLIRRFLCQIPNS